MKIAVSGAVCTGKTTLGRALAERLRLPFIEEHFESLFRDRNADTSPQSLIARIFECLRQKRTMEDQHESFVVDRSPVDLMYRWQRYQLGSHQDPQSVYDVCAEYMEAYDFVVLTPWGSIPFVQSDFGLSRNMNLWVQFAGSTGIAGLAYHFLNPERIIQIPRQMTDHDERLEYVIEQVNRRSESTRHSRMAP